MFICRARPFAELMIMSAKWAWGQSEIGWSWVASTMMISQLLRKGCNGSKHDSIVSVSFRVGMMIENFKGRIMLMKAKIDVGRM
jgi:hypothetical protein